MIWKYMRSCTDGTHTAAFGVPVWAVVGGVRQQVVHQLPGGGQNECVADLRSGRMLCPIKPEHHGQGRVATVANALRDRFAGISDDRVRAVVDAAEEVNVVPEVVGVFGE